MSLNPARVGHRYPSARPYLVSREKIREFADAIGDENPVYRDGDAARALGYPDVIAPPTFPIVPAQSGIDVLRDDEELGLDFSRVVHGNQRFSYVRPVRAGDVLVARTIIDEITSRVGHDMIVAQTQLHTIEGEPVVTSRGMLVVRGD